MAEDTVLVTGGAGFIGSHIVDMLIEQGAEVVVIDNLSTGKEENLHPEAEFYQRDIRDDLSDIFALGIDYVIHQAAQIDVQSSLEEPTLDSEINITGSVNLFQHCVEADVQKVVYASSAAVYGPPQYLGIDEQHPVAPISYYGISKHTPEHYLQAFQELYGLEYTILRYANAYGIRQDPRGEGGVISIFVDKLLSKERPVIFGDGKQTRDFIYVEDIARANLQALTRGQNKIINISCNQATSINELVEKMNQVLGTNLDPIYKEAREGDIRHSYLLNERAESLLDWEPNYSLEEGLKQTFAYYKEIYK